MSHVSFLSQTAFPARFLHLLTCPNMVYCNIRAAIHAGSDELMTRMVDFISKVKGNAALTEFRKQEANILDRVRMQALMALDESLLDPVRRAKIYPQSLAWIYGVLYDKMRLERGESTANVSVLSALVEQAHRPRTATGDPASTGSDRAQDGPGSSGNGPSRDADAQLDPEPPPPA